MSKAKKKHKAKKGSLENLEFLFEWFTILTARLIAHPELNDTVRGHLLDMANDISGFNDDPVAWAAEISVRLPFAFRAAQKEREQGND
jgi:hypothetical protein